MLSLPVTKHEFRLVKLYPYKNACKDTTKAENHKRLGISTFVVLGSLKEEEEEEIPRLEVITGLPDEAFCSKMAIEIANNQSFPVIPNLAQQLTIIFLMNDFRSNNTATVKT